MICLGRILQLITDFDDPDVDCRRSHGSEQGVRASHSAPILQYRIKTVETRRTHPDIVKRLKRAEGHLRGIVAMLEDGRACLGVAQQLQAVESAIGNANKALVHEHIEPVSGKVCAQHHPQCGGDGFGAFSANAPCLSATVMALVGAYLGWHGLQAL